MNERNTRKMPRDAPGPQRGGRVDGHFIRTSCKKSSPWNLSIRDLEGPEDKESVKLTETDKVHMETIRGHQGAPISATEPLRMDGGRNLLLHGAGYLLGGLVSSNSTLLMDTNCV